MTCADAAASFTSARTGGRTLTRLVAIKGDDYVRYVTIAVAGLRVAMSASQAQESQPPQNPEKHFRNDISAMFGVAYHIF